MRSNVLLIAFMVILIGSPLMVAQGLDAERERHRADFLSRFPTFGPGTPTEVHWNDAVYEVRLGQAADLYADRMANYAQMDGADDQTRSEERHDLKHARDRAAFKGPDHVLYAGVFLLAEHHKFHGENPTNACSDTDAHYVARTDNPARSKPHLNEFYGAGYSDVATYGQGSVYDWSSGERIADYRHPVSYAGSSDFFCVELSSGGVGAVFNQPLVSGVVVGAA